MADPLTYLIVFERAEDGGFGAWAPDLPGCFAVGATREECEHTMRDAIAFHLDGLRKLGEPVPPPAAIDATLVQVPAA